MGFPKTLHITDDRKPIKHPDRWKWESAISYMGMAFNSYQLERGDYGGHTGSIYDYYRAFRFVMNNQTSLDIVDEPSITGVCFVSDKRGLTVGIHGIEIRIDNNLPNGRVVLINGDRCASFDWRGRELWADGKKIGYALAKEGE